MNTIQALKHQLHLFATAHFCRKNGLFHGNDICAQAGRFLFSLIETFKKHKINVFSWLKYTLRHIHSATKMELLEKLLPYKCMPNSTSLYEKYTKPYYA